MIPFALMLMLAQPADCQAVELDFQACRRAFEVVDRQALNLRELLELRDVQLEAQRAEVARVGALGRDDHLALWLVGGAGVVGGALLTIAVVLILR